MRPDATRGLLLRVATAPVTGAVDRLQSTAACGCREFSEWLRTSIETLDEGWYRVDGALKLKIDSAAAPRIRQSGGKAELLVPVHLTDGKARIVLEYSW